MEVHMIIDFHTHAFPDALAMRTIEKLSKNSGFVPAGNGTVAGTLKSMRECGIDKSVICNIATNAKQTRNVNRFAVLANKHPELISFGSVHPESDYDSELDFLKESGVSGIKLHPDYQQFFINDPKVIPLYEAILKRGFILIFHTGKDVGVGEPTHAAPDRLYEVLPMFRGENVVFAHMGGFLMWKEAEILLGEDIYLDTSGCPRLLAPEKITDMILRHNPKKILFATDYPWEDPKTGLEYIRSLPLADEVKHGILGENARILLNSNGAEL